MCPTVGQVRHFLLWKVESLCKESFDFRKSPSSQKKFQWFGSYFWTLANEPTEKVREVKYEFDKVKYSYEYRSLFIFVFLFKLMDSGFFKVQVIHLSEDREILVEGLLFNRQSNIFET